MWWFASILLLISTSAHAVTYAYRADNFSYDTPSALATSVTWHTTGNSPACTDYPLGDDDWADITFPIGFTFTFGGVNYSGVRVYSNGMLAFGTDVSGFHREYNEQALPITSASSQGRPNGCTLNAVPKNLMIPYWVDIIAGTAKDSSNRSITGAAVKHEIKTDASTGQKRYVISWDNVALYGDATTRYSFQVVLYSSLTGVNGNFKYQYTLPPSGGGVTGNPGTVGVQLTTTDYTQYSYNQEFIDPILGTAVLWYPANQLAAKAGEYRFDEGAWTGVLNEIKDTSGSSQNASQIGAVTNISNGKLCRGGSFTSNTSNTTIDAVATPITPASQGSIDFWFNSNKKWNQSNAMLFDATKVAAQPFFLLKKNSGALRFVLTDSAGTIHTAETSTAYTYPANDWHHIAVSWNLKPGSNQTVMQIILDGVLVNTNSSTPYRSTSSGAVASFSSVYIGDNRTSGVTPNSGTPSGADGVIDEVYIYTNDINASQAAADMALLRSTCTSLDHFHIIHGGELVSCNGSAANITIEAHDANHALFTLAGTSMQMATSTGHGTWSSISTLNPVSNGVNGAGSYTFSNETSIALGLSNPNFETLNINLNSGGVTEATGAAATCVSQDHTYASTCDANLTFSNSGFIFDALDHIAEKNQNITISAVKRPSNSLVCIPAFQSVTKPVTFTCAYNNPASGTLPVRLTSTAASITTTKALNNDNNTGSACDATGQSLDLAFDNTGVAPISLKYADVGKVTLNAQYSSGGINMTGSDTFIAAPKSFGFSGITGGQISAGNAFSATVTSLNDIGNPTPNFGQESTPESATISFTSRVAPAGTNNCINGPCDGTVTGNVTAPWASGAATASNLSYTEVGQITLGATLASGSYLASGLTATGTSATVGDFVPAYFDTAVTPSCGSFTYSGQPFTVNVTAKNKANATTVNYSSLTGCSVCSKDVTLSDIGATTNFNSTNTIAASAFVKGIGSSNTVAYTFPSKTTAPAIITLRAADTAATSNGHIEGTLPIRSGRVRLTNAYGSELLDLPVTMHSEYWNGNTWAINTSDTCTGDTNNPVTIGLSNITLNPAKTCVWDTGSPGQSGLGCNTAGVSTKRYKEGATLAGDFNLWLKAPGTGNNGSVGVSATIPAWLYYNWTGTVTAPAARATFGIYKTPIIYIRENY